MGAEELLTLLKERGTLADSPSPPLDSIVADLPEDVSYLLEENENEA